MGTVGDGDDLGSGRGVLADGAGRRFRENKDKWKRYHGNFLYGSYARGDYDDESDIDIAAVVKGRRQELQDKWNKDILPYYRNIVKEGKRIG